MHALVDSQVILDILTNDSSRTQRSIETLTNVSNRYMLAINPIIYAELSIGFDKIEDLDEALVLFKRLPLPFEAGFLASKVFMNYRQDDNNKATPLPGFYIGAHAAISGLPLITRDTLYGHYFPTVEIITP